MKSKISKLLPVIFIILAGIWGIKAFFVPEFYTSHDGPAHLSRLAQYVQQLRDGQLPPRWSSTLYGNLGYPIFVYSYHLPFAVGAVFYNLGAKLHESIELVMGLGYLVSGVGMYYYLRQFFGKWASLVGAMFYLYAPYRFSLLFVRAAIGETTALAFLPLVLLFITKYIKNKRPRDLALAAVCLSGSLTSHPLFLPMYVPILLLYTAVPIAGDIKQRVMSVLKVIFLGVLISSFYVLPLIFERKYVSFDEVYTNQAPNHLITLSQMWHSPWGYGFSMPGSTIDDMSFQVGLAQIMVLVIYVVILTWGVIKRKTENKYLGYYYLLIFGIAVMVMHDNPVTRWVWYHVPGLKVIDFPWRFLGMTTLAASYMVAYVVSRARMKQVVAMGLLVAVGFANRNHLNINLPEKIDEEKVFSDTGTTAYANEYRPIWRATSLRNTIADEVESEGDPARWQLISTKSNLIKFETDFEQPTTMQVNSLYFPGWRAYEITEGKKKELALGEGLSIVKTDTYKYKASEIVGTMQVETAPGKHIYELRFGETPLRRLGNLLSMTAVIYALLCIFAKKHK